MTAEFFSPRPQYFKTVNGALVPLSGGKLFFYDAGTTTKAITYSDYGLTSANTNPIVLNAQGRPDVDIFLSVDDYKVVLTDSTDTDPPTSPIWTSDNYSISATQAFSGGLEMGSNSVRSYHPVNNQTGTSYTILTGDRASLLTLSNTSAIAISLPQANNTTFASGWYIYIQNRNTGLVTITPTTSTIDGLSSISLGKDECVMLVSDATNYYSFRMTKSQFVNAQTGTTYTFVAGDRGKLVTFSNSSAIAATLPQAGTSFPDGWFMDVQNRNTGALTITPTTSTIDGASSISLVQDAGCRIFSNGTNYFTQRGTFPNATALLSTQSGGVSVPSITFTGFFSSVYKAYLLLIERARPAGSGDRMVIRVGNGSINSGASAYAYSLSENVAGSAADSGNASTNLIHISNAAGVGNGTHDHISSEIWINDPTNSTGYPMIEFHSGVSNIGGGGSFAHAAGGGILKTGGAIDRIQVFFSGSSNVDSGIFKLYGFY